MNIMFPCYALLNEVKGECVKENTRDVAVDVLFISTVAGALV